MDEGTILEYCCPSTVPSLWPPPPSPLPNVHCTVYTDSVWLWGWGVLKCTVDHILQEFYTLFLTRIRTYKIASPPQTKMTSKDDIKGLVSLKFLRPWALPSICSFQNVLENKVLERASELCVYVCQLMKMECGRDVGGEGSLSMCESVHFS